MRAARSTLACAVRVVGPGPGLGGHGRLQPAVAARHAWRLLATAARARATSWMALTWERSAWTAVRTTAGVAGGRARGAGFGCRRGPADRNRGNAGPGAAGFGGGGGRWAAVVVVVGAGTVVLAGGVVVVVVVVVGAGRVLVVVVVVGSAVGGGRRGRAGGRGGGGRGGGGRGGGGGGGGGRGGRRRGRPVTSGGGGRRAGCGQDRHSQTDCADHGRRSPRHVRDQHRLLALEAERSGPAPA